MKNQSFEKKAAILFSAFIFFFGIGNLLTPDSHFSAEENRILETMPSLSPITYIEGRFEQKAEKYVSDQFILRNFFVKVKTAFDRSIGMVESNGVFLGRDKYLIDKIEIPTKDRLDNITCALENFQKKYPDIESYFLLAPTAGNILKIKLPATVKLDDQNKYMDDFFSRAKNIGITPIDVRKDFISAKDSTQLYYRTDHHWTTTGAYIAYSASKPILGIENDVEYEILPVEKDFRGTLASKSGFVNGQNDQINLYIPKEEENRQSKSILFFSDDKKKTTSYYQLDNLKKKDAYTVFGGWNHPYYTINTASASQDRLLLVKDSYANCFIPFLMDKYREIVVVDPRYFFGKLDEIIEREGITKTLFLYNANTLANDDALALMLN